MPSLVKQGGLNAVSAWPLSAGKKKAHYKEGALKELICLGKKWPEMRINALVPAWFRRE
jgi:hypothetical protein